jgi:hypothetical protein
MSRRGDTRRIKPDARSRAVTEDDPPLLERCLDPHERVFSDRVSLRFEVADRLNPDARSVGEIFLGPIQQSTCSFHVSCDEPHFFLTPLQRFGMVLMVRNKLDTAATVDQTRAQSHRPR